MSGLDKSFGVRISGAEGDAAREVAEFIGPVVDRATVDLMEALEAGPLVVATDLEFEEAQQFANVLANLGATPAVVQQVEGADDTWIAVPFERTPPPIASAGVDSTINMAALKFGPLRADPADSSARRPPGSSTNRFDVDVLRAGLTAPVESLPPIVLNQPPEFGNVPPPPAAETSMRATEVVEVSLGPTDSRVDVEEMEQAALDRALRVEAERLKAAGAPIPADVSLDDPDSTGRFERPGGRPVTSTPRAIGNLTTQRFGQIVAPPRHDPAQDSLATSEFRRPNVSDILKTSSFSDRELGALVVKMDAPEVEPTESGFMPQTLDLATAAADLPELDLAGLGEGDEDEPRRFTVVPGTPTPAPLSEEASPAPTPPPVDFDEPAPHSPAKAALLGVFLPGMGQVYNGQRERGVWFALGAVLIVPWVYGVVDAWGRAREIVVGERARPLKEYARSATLAHLALVLAIVCGISLGRAFLPYLRPQPAPAPQRIVVQRPAPVRAAAKPRPRPRVAIAPPPTAPAMKPSEVQGLLDRGRAACGQKLFAECGLLMEAILDAHPEQPEALKLLATASKGERRGR